MLSEVGFDVQEGEVVSVVGANERRQEYTREGNLRNVAPDERLYQFSR